MVVYQINLKGFSPTYYTNREEAMQKYNYIKRYFPCCSMRKMKYIKMLVKVFC